MLEHADIISILALALYMFIRDIQGRKNGNGKKIWFEEDEKKTLHELRDLMKDHEREASVRNDKTLDKLSVIGEIDPQTGLLRCWGDKEKSRRMHDKVTLIHEVLPEMAKTLTEIKNKL